MNKHEVEYRTNEWVWGTVDYYVRYSTPDAVFKRWGGTPIAEWIR
jgi:hypothetical protein